jgi:hypothetical protein
LPQKYVRPAAISRLDGSGVEVAGDGSEVDGTPDDVGVGPSEDDPDPVIGA